MPTKQGKSYPHGIGAVAKVMLRFLHPSILVKEKYKNFSDNAVISGLSELREEKKRVNRREQACFVFHHAPCSGCNCKKYETSTGFRLNTGEMDLKVHLLLFHVLNKI